MAIFGSFQTVQDQLRHDRRFAAAFAYVGDMLRPGSAVRNRLEQLAVGSSQKFELENGAVAIEQAYETKLRPDGFFESHRKFIDVQVIVTGAEWMEVADIRLLPVSQPFLEERDLIKYGDFASGSVLSLAAGDAAILFPVDGHMPGLRPGGVAGLVRKTVVKVPVS
jgi:biofilm protein TabA